MNRKIQLAACLFAGVLLTACSKNSESSVTGAVVTMPTGTSSSQSVETKENSVAESSNAQEQSQAEPSQQGESHAENDPQQTLDSNASASEADPVLDYGPLILTLEAPTEIPNEGVLPVTVSMPENPGIDLIAVRLYYDEPLDPVGTDTECTYSDGAVTEGFLSTCALNRNDRIIGYVAYSTATTGASGDLFHVQLKLPADVKSGDSYTFRMEVVQCLISGTDISGGTFTETITMQ